VAAAALLASACGSESSDPRLGEEGRVRFVGGGCTGSTTLAVGARVSLHLESATEEPLPGDLDVRSGEPSIISARMGVGPATVELQAHKQGESRIEVLSENDPIDALVFGAEPAGLVKHTSVSRAFQGGFADVLVTDVFGDCGENEDCRLIGDTFLEWRMDPPELGSFVLDFDGVASFRAKAEGEARLLGREPSRGRDLVMQPLEIVLPTAATGLSARLTTLSFDPEQKSVEVALPGSVARPDAFVIRVDGVLTDGSTVPISWRDVAWRIEGDEIVIAAPAGDAGDPLGTAFLTAGVGTVNLVVDVAMLGLEQTFALELTEP
jgi:hypothetical protein